MSPKIDLDNDKIIETVEPEELPKGQRFFYYAYCLKEKSMIGNFYFDSEYEECLAFAKRHANMFGHRTEVRST